MGILLRSDFEDEISRFLGNRSDISSARLVRWLNLAQTRIGRLKDFTELQDLTTSATVFNNDANDKFVTLPTGVRKIRNIRLIDGDNSRPISVLLYPEFDKQVPSPIAYARGRPTVATRWQNKLEFWKVPDAVYTLEIRTILNPTAFTTSSDVVSVLDQKDDALLMLTISWGFASLRNMDDSGRYFRIYAKMINEILGEEAENPDIDIVGFSGPGNVRPGNPWSDPFKRDNDSSVD